MIRFLRRLFGSDRETIEHARRSAERDVEIVEQEASSKVTLHRVDRALRELEEIRRLEHLVRR